MSSNGSDNTKSQQRGLVPFKPGQSGNPKGRPKGSRNKINEAFLQDFFEAWEAFGRPALMATAWTDPAAFVKVAAALLPKELNVTVESRASDMSDDELAAIATGSSEGAFAPEVNPKVFN